MAKKIAKTTGWTIAYIIKGRVYIGRAVFGTRRDVVNQYDLDHHIPGKYEVDSKAGKVKAVRCTITAEVEV